MVGNGLGNSLDTYKKKPHTELSTRYFTNTNATMVQERCLHAQGHAVKLWDCGDPQRIQGTSVGQTGQTNLRPWSGIVELISECGDGA